jgi:ribosome-binding factor A
MSPRRADRVGERVRDELARIISTELRDPGVGFVTITSVELSPDLRHARVYVSVLGADLDASIAALRRATPFLRRELAHRAGLRFTPELRFLGDASIATGSRVERLLRDLEDERSTREPRSETDGDTSEDPG